MPYTITLEATLDPSLNVDLDALGEVADWLHTAAEQRLGEAVSAFAQLAERTVGVTYDDEVNGRSLSEAVEQALARVGDLFVGPGFEGFAVRAEPVITDTTGSP